MLSARESEVLESVPTDVFIGGVWQSAATGGRFAVEDPSTEATLVEVADAGPDEANAALDAAVEAQPSWAATAPRERSQILRRAFELLIERSDVIATLITLEMGKSIAESKAEVAYGAEFLRWFSEEAVRIRGMYMASPARDGRLLTTRQPVGPCLLITPWNFPLAMAARKLGPAFAAGCTTVVKPAQLTPLTTLAFAAILEEAGLPAGVCNVITTTRSGATVGPVMADRRLRKLSFTGSTEVGQKLMAQAADNLLRISLELGGNAPFIVLDDADLDAAVNGAAIAKMRNIGQSCVAANRFLVHESRAAEFTDRLADRLRGMRLGRGTAQGVDVGPLINADARKKVVELVDDAVDHGARLVLGGHAPDGPGYFYEPTVLADVPADARCQTEEIFGPVAPVRSIGTNEEAIAAANDTEYGLVAYLYTRDVARALETCEALEAGMVGLNRGLVSNPAGPFGGVKHSGLGREGGAEGIEEYLAVKYVAVDLS
ncbi:MAG: NAD-dependent succinate-semialdehyde dehydrogenase [Acidimicrobiales bacterium]